jgi:hypothetical protein
VGFGPENYDVDARTRLCEMWLRACVFSVIVLASVSSGVTRDLSGGGLLEEHRAGGASPKCRENFAHAERQVNERNRAKNDEKKLRILSAAEIRNTLRRFREKLFAKKIDSRVRVSHARGVSSHNKANAFPKIVARSHAKARSCDDDR